MKKLFLLLPLIVAAQDPTPTFRTGTELVQVSVIAQDKQGKPVADLRREDFQVFADGLPREIRLFIAEKPLPASGAAAARQPNLFTNQTAEDGSRSGYSVILFDNLVTGFGKPEEAGTSYGALQVIRMMQSLPEGEKIALYAVGRKLKIVREFTSDKESLVQELKTWTPSPDDAERGQALCPAADTVSSAAIQLAPEVGVGLARAGAECARGECISDDGGAHE